MKKNKALISVVVITKNEQDMISGCLKSVKWADEIIVIDASSTDDTVNIAKRYTNKIYRKEWSGFATQKNYGIKKATGDWILILDADERVSKELKTELLRVAQFNSDIVAYNIHFRNFFLGKEMKYGGWQEEYHIRFFKRNFAKYIEQEIHEILDIKGSVAPISKSILHFSHRDIASNLLKTRQYAIVESKYHFERGAEQITSWKLFRNIIDHFYYRFIKAKGYKDGMEGFIEATYQSFSQIFVIQSMLWERQRKKTSKELYKNLDKKLEENKFSL